MPRVWNKRDPDCPKDAIYVGRPSKWGNAAVIGIHGDRNAVLRWYRQAIAHRHNEIKQELKGKDLVCWCAPKPCHADILLEIANTEEMYGELDSKR